MTTADQLAATLQQIGLLEVEHAIAVERLELEHSAKVGPLRRRAHDLHTRLAAETLAQETARREAAEKALGGK